MGEPVRHQVEELPQRSTIVVEHQCARVRCPDCGRRERAELPTEIAASALGPRLQAAITMLAIRNRISRRDASSWAGAVRRAVSTGTVDAILTRVGDALDDPTTS